MFQAIIETLAEVVSGLFAEKYVPRATNRLPPKVRGWLSLAILTLVVAFFTGMGIWLIRTGEPVWVAIIMFLFAVMVLAITALSIIKGRRK